MLLFHKPRSLPRAAFRPRLDTLEGSDAPAQLVVVGTPAFTPTGAARTSAIITPFPNGYGMAWDGHAEVAPPSGAGPGSFHPGTFTWSGNLDVLVQAEAGEVDGTPVHILLSGGGRVTWDLDPRTSSGFTTSTVALTAAREGQPAWFNLTGGQSNPANHSETSDTQSSDFFEQIDTTIGSTIRIAVTSSGDSKSWVSTDFRGKVSADFGVGYYLPPDLVAGPLSWDINGGVNFQYSVNFQHITPGVTPTASLFWGDDDGPTGGAIYTEEIPHNPGTYNRHLSALAPPPTNATHLYLVLNDDHATDEQDFANNTSSIGFTHAVVITGAKYDGNAQPNVIGRFFSGVTIPDQNYTIQITPDLAALVRDPRQISVRVGTTTLAVHPSDTSPSWDHLTYVTDNHNPGLLTRDTAVQVRVLSGGRELASASQTIDMELLPAWLRTVRPLQKGFDTNTLTYSFSGPLLNLSSGSRYVSPGAARWLGSGGPNRVDVTATVQVAAPLDVTQTGSLTVGGSGRARGYYRGHPIFDVTGAFPSAGPFDAAITLDPQTLAMLAGSISLNLNGTTSINDVFGTGAFAKGYFRITPQIDALVSYTTTMSVAFGPDGRLNFSTSGLDFSFQGGLTGTMTPSISLGGTLNAALWKLNNVLGVPRSVTDQIRADLSGTADIPDVALQASVVGELDVNGSVKFGGTGLLPSTSLRSFHGLFDLTPTVSFLVTWPSGTFSNPNSALLSSFFAVHSNW